MSSGASSGAAEQGDPPGGSGTSDQLLAFQRFAWSSLVISVTRRCPLRCGHCITRSGPDAGASLPVELARLWASELPGLAGRGLRHISFTGGEPVLALESLVLLSEAAAAAGIGNYVVTSGVWATSPKAADRVVARLARVDRWDVGYDAFHAADMPEERLRNALAAFERRAAPYTLRVCVGSDPETSRDLLEGLGALVGPHGSLMTQSLRRLGRGSQLEALRTDRAELPHRPCVSTGLFVRADGSTGPCCSGLAYEARGAHPFEYGACTRPGGLSAAWTGWRQDPLLRLLRLAGFGALEGWLAEEDLRIEGAPFSSDPCEACVALWTRRPEAAQRLLARAMRPDVRAKLDLLEEALYGQVWREPTPPQRATG